MKWYHKFNGNLLYFLFRAFSLLPEVMVFAFMRAVQFMAEKIIKYRYQVVVQNLSLSFPDQNYAFIRKTAHEFYTHFFEIFAELIISQSFTFKQARDRFHFENPDLLQSNYNEGYNTIIISGHTGNWEWITLSPVNFQFSSYCLYKPLSNKSVDYLMHKLRGRFKLNLLAMQQAGKFLLSNTDNPAVYYFVADQSPSHKDPGFSYTFLNQPAFFFTGGARLAQKTNSALVYMHVVKLKRGYYSVRFSPIYKPDETMQEKEMLASYVSLLESDIRNQPPMWLWSHKRWKHKVPNS